MKLDLGFACPSCGKRLKLTGEIGGKEPSWDLDIRYRKQVAEDREVKMRKKLSSDGKLWNPY